MLEFRMLNSQSFTFQCYICENFDVKTEIDLMIRSRKSSPKNRIRKSYLWIFIF